MAVEMCNDSAAHREMLDLPTGQVETCPEIKVLKCVLAEQCTKICCIKQLGKFEIWPVMAVEMSNDRAAHCEMLNLIAG